MKIGKKITIGFLVIVTIFTIFGYSIYLNEKSIETLHSHFADEIIIELNTLQELKSSTLKVSTATMEIISIIGERDFVQQQQQIEIELASEKKEISQGISNFENAFDLLIDLTFDEQFELDSANNIKEKWDVFLSTSKSSSTSKMVLLLDNLLHHFRYFDCKGSPFSHH